MFDYGNGIQNHAVWYCLDFYVPLNGYYWDDMIYLLYTDHNLFIEPKPISNKVIMKIFRYENFVKWKLNENSLSIALMKWSTETVC